MAPAAMLTRFPGFIKSSLQESLDLSLAVHPIHGKFSA
jgi:hypothetical protein